MGSPPLKLRPKLKLAHGKSLQQKVRVTRNWAYKQYSNKKVRLRWQNDSGVSRLHFRILVAKPQPLIVSKWYYYSVSINNLMREVGISLRSGRSPNQVLVTKTE